MDLQCIPDTNPLGDLKATTKPKQANLGALMLLDVRSPAPAAR